MRKPVARNPMAGGSLAGSLLRPRVNPWRTGAVARSLQRLCGRPRRASPWSAVRPGRESVAPTRKPAALVHKPVARQASFGDRYGDVVSLSLGNAASRARDAASL